MLLLLPYLLTLMTALLSGVASQSCTLLTSQVGCTINGNALIDYGTTGTSVAMSQDGLTMATGSIYGEGTGGLLLAGTVTVWDLNSTSGVWIQRGLTMSGEAGSDQFGGSVSMSAFGDRVAVGASSNDGSGTNAGSTRVFEWIAGAWTKIGVADLDGEAAGDLSGTSVSLSGSGLSLAVGAYLNDGSGRTNGGHVRVFDWSSVSSSWVRRGLDIDGEVSTV